MIRAFALFTLLFIGAIAQDAYICNVLYPNYGVAAPQITLEGITATFNDNFNVISFGSFYSPSGDVEGRAAIRNDLNVTHYSFGYQLRTSGASAMDTHFADSLVVGHDAIFPIGAVLPDGTNFPYAGLEEGIYVGGSLNGEADLVARASVGAGNLDSTFDAAQSYYTTLQNAFAAVTPNANAVIQYGGITITCNSASDSSISVNIDAADFSTVTYYNPSVNCNGMGQLVINIGGTADVVFQGDNIYTPAQEFVLYNILGSGRNVRITTEVRGNVLAPNNNYNQPGEGVVMGLVIVGNVQQVLQINRVDCIVPVTPASTTFCPAWESNCAGLAASIGSDSFSFRDFNVISFGDFNANTGDIQGRLAARGNVNIGAGFTVGALLSTVNNVPDNDIAYSVIAGRNLTWVSGNVFPDGTTASHAESLFVGGVASFPNEADLAARVAGTCSGSAGCLDAMFDAAYSCYSGYSTFADSFSDNTQHSIYYSGLFVTCNDASADQYVITLTATEFSQFTYVSTSGCNFQAFWIINVPGTDDVTLTGDSWPAIPGATLYNIMGQRTINVHDTAVTGAILAPDATLNQYGGVINGKVVVASVAMALQINRENTCAENITVLLPIVASASAQQGQNTISCNGAADFRVGDNTTLGQIEAINGNQVTFTTPLSAPVSAGAFVGYDVVPSTAGRAYVANPTTNSASVAGIAVAVLAIAALVL